MQLSMSPQVLALLSDITVSAVTIRDSIMSEHHRLQKIRELGIRLQELQLIDVPSNASYASSALNFLFRLYRLSKPAGMRLEDALLLLGQAIIQKHQLPYLRLNADAVLLFLQQRFAAGHSPRLHPGYRARERSASSTWC